MRSWRVGKYETLNRKQVESIVTSIGLCDVRWSGCGEMENCKLLWSGNNEHENGVGMYLVG